MKKIIYLAAFVLSFNFVAAQKLMKTVYVNKGAITPHAKEAEWLIAIRNVDGRYERNDYKMNGPLKRVKTFKDLNQTILEGNFLEYDDNGNLQVAGYYTDHKKSGKWFYFNEAGDITRTEKFEGKGIYEEVGNHVADRDSLVPPAFKSGKNEWRNYLHETLNWDPMAIRSKDKEVKISFTITESGTVKNLILMKSEYFNADNEIIRTISAAPRWKPASFRGKPVSYRYIQSLTLYNLVNASY